MLFVVAVVVFLFAPAPWDVIGLVAGLALGAGEVAYWNRSMRGRRIQAGATTLLGRRGKVVTLCSPTGQVRLEGESEIWRARCADGAEPGENVIVRDVDDITLVVERVAA